MQNGLNKHLKEIIREFVIDEKILSKPKGNIIKHEIGSDRLEFLVKLIDLVLNTKFTCYETKIYLSNYYISISEVCNQLRREGYVVNNNTVKAKIFYDKKKIAQEFGNDIIVDIVERTQVDMKEISDKLNKLRIKYSYPKLLDNILLDIDVEKYLKNEYHQVNDEEFKDLLLILAPYTKNHVRFVGDNLPENTVSYMIGLLIDNPEFMGDEKKKHKEMIESLLR